MLKLVVLTDEAVTEGALEHPPPVIPHPSVALDAGGVGQRTGAGVSREALPTVADPSLTEITDSSLIIKGDDK